MSQSNIICGRLLGYLRVIKCELDKHEPDLESVMAIVKMAERLGKELQAEVTEDIAKKDSN